MCTFVHIAYSVVTITLLESYLKIKAHRGGVEVAGWTLDREIRVRFPVHTLTACGPSNGKGVKDLFRRLGVRVGVGSIR